MVTRRHVIQTVGGLGLFAAIPHSSGAADAALPLHRVVFDSRHGSSLRFAAEAQRLGFETRDTRGDVAALYLRELLTRWRRGPIAVAGLTPLSQLFGLRLMAESPRLRLVFVKAMECGQVYGPELVCKAACDADPAATARILCRWAAADATVAKRRSSIAAAQDHPFTADDLVAWLIAPVPRHSQV